MCFWCIDVFVFVYEMGEGIRGVGCCSGDVNECCPLLLSNNHFIDLWKVIELRSIFSGFDHDFSPLIK